MCVNCGFLVPILTALHNVYCLWLRSVVKRQYVV